MSQNIYELMSDEGKEHCRRIDKVDQIYSDFHFGFYFFICFSNFFNLNFLCEIPTGDSERVRGPYRYLHVRLPSGPGTYGSI